MKSPSDSAGRSLSIGRRTFLSSLLIPAIPAIPKMPNVQQEPMLLTKGLAIGGVARGGRQPFLEDAVQKAIVQGKWLPPSPGDAVTPPSGPARKWETIEADKDGWFQGPALSGGGYLYATWDAPEERTCLLVAQGNSMVYLNGEPRAGDIYSFGTFALPVRLRKGTNSFLFASGRGRIRAQLFPVTAGLILRAEDSTLPDLIVGEMDTLWGAIPIVNTQDKEWVRLTLKATVEGVSGSKPHSVETRLPPLPPMTVRKIGFRFAAPKGLAAGKATLRVELIGQVPSGGVAPITMELRVRKPEETYKRTFVSEMDGTVQYYGVRPALKPSPENALILTLHGASVEAIGQADAYGAKDWATLVAPTNRRPYGFDWEDWGRGDALEVLEVAQKQFAHDPARVSLTGHSMGGHGSWSIGSLFPDRFAAIGPSAGWISFNTYGGRTRGTDREKPVVTALIERAANQTDTFLWASNLLSMPVYILHGDADDNVPISEARTMRDRLVALKHPALQMHEQPGAGHWWDVSPDPGADCVDWKPMFALFQKSRIGPVAQDGSPDVVRFTTVSPAVSDRFRWARVLQQVKPLLPSVVDLKWDPGSGTVRGTTQNVAFLTLDAALLIPHGRLRRLEIDGQTLDVPESMGKGIVPLVPVQGRWQVARSLPSANDKSPERGSGFKQAFRHRFVLVYGTHGTPEENAWAYNRVRYDAEAFLYRGNGSPEILADVAFEEHNFRDRSIILYGNATMNAVWQRMLKDSPLIVERGKIRAGNREWTGEEMATVFLLTAPGFQNRNGRRRWCDGNEGTPLDGPFALFCFWCRLPRLVRFRYPRIGKRRGGGPGCWILRQ